MSGVRRQLRMWQDDMHLNASPRGYLILVANHWAIEIAVVFFGAYST